MICCPVLLFIEGLLVVPEYKSLIQMIFQNKQIIKIQDQKLRTKSESGEKNESFFLFWVKKDLYI